MLIDRHLINLTAEDIVPKIDDATKRMLLDGPPKSKDHIEAIVYVAGLQSFQRWVRNSYKLWTDSELTARWRREGPNDLREGVDYSTDHPDNMSEIIITRVKEILAEQRNKIASMTDALGNRLKLGYTYGYSSSSGGWQTTVVCHLMEVRPDAKAKVMVLQRKRFLYGEPSVLEEATGNKPVLVHACILFPLETLL